MMFEKLDNPCWYSLCEVHRHFSIDIHGFKFYRPDYIPFGANILTEKSDRRILEFPGIANDFFLVGNDIMSSDYRSSRRELICNQMILDSPIQFQISAQIVKIKTEAEQEELFELVNLIQPGYFRRRTIELGDYYGIYDEQKLVAVIGERMKMACYTEVSAIVTHPLYRGRNYAKQLIVYATNRIFADGKVPYLHVVENNANAIGLYEKLGFINRRKISFYHYKK